MPEYSDYTPAPWSESTTFTETRREYDEHVGRSYDNARKKGVKSGDLVPQLLRTTAKWPVVLWFDVTGSMGSWPATMFSKAAYVDHEANVYFEGDYAIAVGAYGDANYPVGREGDQQYHLQMRPFAKGEEIPKRLKELVIEGGGGSDVYESAELGALYVDRNVEAPNAERPIMVFVTDEKCYNAIGPDQAKEWCKVDLERHTTTKEIFASLRRKGWQVYVIRKQYGASTGNADDEINREIKKFWEDMVGADHIAFLPEASRVVDVIFGIFAQETAKVEEFRQELKDRQLKDEGGQKKVDTVLTALGSIHANPDRKRSKKLTPTGEAEKAETKALPAPEGDTTRGGTSRRGR